ncbi:ESCRT-III subunit protein snf7 [Lignoscripta atroalba]|nr:ESCRT-III subunit protein snf7 [Lignoscripta atroalba]
MWGTWFGGSGGQKRKDAPKKAILDLRQQLEMLQKRERHLENLMQQQDDIARKNVSTNKTAARTALKRKKAHEHSLEQTSAQISMLENQIYSIESANINQETLIAMKNAGQAMKQIHGSLTMDKVDQTLYVYDLLFSAITPNSDLPVKYINKANQQSLQRREEIRDQHALAEEISSAITSGPIVGEAIDEEELDEELQQLEQENLDAKMLNTGSVPVADSLNRLPAGPNGELKGKSRIQPEEEDEEAELEKLKAEMAI